MEDTENLRRSGYVLNDRTWKVERKCKECGVVFIPCNPSQVTCGNKKCKQRRNMKLPGYRALNKRACRVYKQKLREKFLDMYGRACVCCGESCPTFLTVDHKQNDGKIERDKTGGEPYKTLRIALTVYNPDKYQVLCFNCNCGRNINGGICPHKSKAVII